MDFRKLSEITGVSPDELGQRYQTWLGSTRTGKRGPDLKLIAAFSNLSVSSVSSHINKRAGSISRAKAQMLDSLLSALDYQPSHAAKKLRSKSKMSIGFIAPITNSPSTEYSVEILKGLKTEAHKYGYFVDIYDIAQEDQQEVTSRLPFLGLVDGLIVVSSSISSASFAPLRPENIPVLQVNPLKEQRETPFVGAINSETAPFADLLEHLFSDHKYRNPVLVHVPAEGHVQRQKKEELYIRAADRFGVSIRQDRNFIPIEAFTYNDGRVAWNRANEINPDADVYICLSDVVAVPIIQGLQREGRRAAVTGYGNFEIAECFEITTIDQHICQVGSDAFQQLYYAIQFIKMQGEFPAYRSTTGPASLIRRKTCACKAG